MDAKEENVIEEMVVDSENSEPTPLVITGSMLLKIIVFSIMAIMMLVISIIELKAVIEKNRYSQTNIKVEAMVERIIYKGENNARKVL